MGCAILGCVVTFLECIISSSMFYDLSQHLFSAQISLG